ncbi:DNA polymerase lambda [Mycena chlorophos]|uniref:DNA-directed DNA polymerase n=1 Tax=Mycena chlorophos TaxID=658473 RepID=A0A8H6TQU2_MYCCL|nr:DNA polymerase lambda [Mycena chlorophos]
MAAVVDVDAFYRERDERMRIPADHQFAQRIANKSHRPPERSRVAFPVPTRKASVHPPDTTELDMNEVLPNQYPPSIENEEQKLGLISPQVNIQDLNVRTGQSTKSSAAQPSPHESPRKTTIDPRADLKRKASPGPTQQSSKKQVIDAPTEQSSSAQVPVLKPPSKKLQTLSKVPPPLAVNIPQAPTAPVIDLSSSPIEEPNFSVMVSRFEPQATSTQAPKPLAAEPTAFERMVTKIKEKEKQDKARKARKAPTVVKLGVGPDAAGPSVPSVKAEDDIISVSSSRPPSPQPKRKATKKPSTKVPAKAATVKSRMKKKSPKKAPPAEDVHPRRYAETLLARLEEDPDDPLVRQESTLLTGKTIFLVTDELGDWTSKKHQNRFGILIRNGATLVTVYDPNTVTHIICETAMGRPTACEALGVKSLSEVPDHIFMVTWDWGVEKKATGKAKAPAKRSTPKLSDGDDSDDERERHGPPARKRRTSPTGFVAVSASHANQPVSTALNGPAGTMVDDPLAEFHAEAVNERLAERREKGYDSDDSDVEERRLATAFPEFANKTGNPNQYIIDKLEELKNLHEARGGEDKWRAITYTKVLRQLRLLKEPIRTRADAFRLKHVAEKTANKIMEIVKTGDLRRLKYERTPDLLVRQVFQGIYGVGPDVSQRFYLAGCRTLQDLADGVGGVKLNEAQQIGLKYYEDINSRMPRAEAEEIFTKYIQPAARKIDSKLEVHIMGSFRRGKPTCGDIDVMITRDPADGKTHEGILTRLLKALHDNGVITEDLAIPGEPDGEEAIYRGLCRLPNTPNAQRRRLDFLVIPWKCRGAALMYYTGDDIFNRKMRFKANRMGYSLNQRGLFDGVVRNPSNWSEKLNQGNVIASESEEEIFKILGVPFLLPHQRAGLDVSLYNQ